MLKGKRSKLELGHQAEAQHGVWGRCFSENQEPMVLGFMEESLLG
jgi:hypothetical protein